MLPQMLIEYGSTLLPNEGVFLPVVPGISRLCTVFVNLYLVDLPDGGWILVDTGVPNLAWYVRQAVAKRYGSGARPTAIVLTHGHFDHAGNALELANVWDVPIIAHPLELPYLTGRSDYPPQDPTPGGAICFLSRFFPSRGTNFGDRIQPIQADGSINQMPGWRWIHTPGHTAGHMSLLREEDHALLAGDAIVTTDLDVWSDHLTWPKKLSRPPTPLTPDWLAARESIRELAKTDPSVIAAGHGLPIFGDHLADDLRAFADSMPEPPHGRYTAHPVQYATDGSVSELPPNVPDPLPRNLALGALGTAITIGLLVSTRPARHSTETIRS